MATNEILGTDDPDVLRGTDGQTSYRALKVTTYLMVGPAMIPCTVTTATIP